VFISSKDMTEKLSEYITQQLQLQDTALRVVVVEWYNPDNMVNDLLRGQSKILVSVKRGDTVTGRKYNRVPLCESTLWEVGVWLQDTPHYRKNKSTPPREIVVELVKQFYREYPLFGTEKASLNKDHAKNNMWILYTNIIVTQLNEELKNK